MRGALLIACLTAACAQAQETLAVRVLPQPLATNCPASRIGLQAGLCEEEWGPQALAALKSAEPGYVRWPVGRGAERYSWYDGVGPFALRRAASGAASGPELGTLEFVRLCRQIAAEPQLRVALEVPFDEAAAQRAADWVAYCNAPADQPLGALRARHGCAEPLGVRRWELALPAGARPEAAALESACRAMAVALRTADRAAEVGLSLAPDADPSLAAAGRRACASGLLGWVEVQADGLRDRYVAGVLDRLAAAGGADRAAFEAWYEGLAAMNAALQRMRAGAGPLFAPGGFGGAVRRDAAGGRSLTEAGALMALYNRFPPAVALAVEGVPADAGSPLQVAAAWTEQPSMLVAFVYNSGPEPRKVRLDLSPLGRRFAFWAAEQLTGEIEGRRAAGAVPVARRQKAGSALTQAVTLEVRPASFTRVVVKE